MPLTQVPPALLTSTTGTGSTVALSASPTFTGTVTTPSVTFSDASTQTAAASPYVLKNRIINGAMVIDQRNAGASVSTTTTGSAVYTVDRWFYQVSQASKFTVQQDAGAVTPPEGFNDYLGITSTSAYSVTSGDYLVIGQTIEGFNIADLGFGTANAKTITLSFWVRSSLTGTFGGALRGGNSTVNAVSYPFSYSIPTANTWTKISLTIPGSTIGASWQVTNGAALAVWFSMGTGSTLSGTAGAWVAANLTSATGATSVVGTSGATWYVTGVQLEIGTTATPFERRLYGQELINCQRYYWQKNNETSYAAFGAGTMNAATVARIYLDYPTTMRAIPTVSATSLASFIVSQGTDLSVSGITAYSNSGGALVDFTTSTGTVGRGVVIVFNNTSSGSIQASAEL